MRYTIMGLGAREGPWRSVPARGSIFLLWPPVSKASSLRTWKTRISIMQRRWCSHTQTCVSRWMTSRIRDYRSESVGSNALRLLRFGIVGALATAVYYAVLRGLVELLRVAVLVASSIAFLLVCIENYILHYIWAFASRKPHRVALLRFSFLTLDRLLDQPENHTSRCIENGFQLPFGARWRDRDRNTLELFSQVVLDLSRSA